MKRIVVLVPLVIAGCAALEAPRYRGPRSDHFDGERFFNYERLHDNQVADAIRIGVGRHKRGRWRQWEETATDTPPARVGHGMLRVTFVNHATVLLQMDSLNILTDPMWATRASPVEWIGPKRHRPPGIRFEDLPPIDVVLLSHNHYDHMDLATLRRLQRAFHPRIIAGLGNAAYLARQGIVPAEDIDWWQSSLLAPGVRVIGVPARHWSARGLSDQRRTLWLGFVLESLAGRIYFAGDTGYGEFLSMIRNRFAPLRLALLPIGPIRPRRALAERHMSAAEAVRAYGLLGAQAAIATHFGTFQQGDDGEDEPVDSLRTAVGREAPCTVHFFALRNGESLTLTSPGTSLHPRADGCP
ncbi:MAG: MBL fold metallo-hydrolase [Gemmatimonadaceae bacterium]